MSTEPNPLFQSFHPAPSGNEGVGEAIANALEQPRRLVLEPPKNGRKKKGAAKKTPTVAKKPAAPKVPRKKKAVARASKAAPAPKFDMLKILQATAALKEADMKMFEELAGAFLAMGKPARARILPAIQKLFA